MASRKLLLPSCTVYQLGRGREPMIDVGRTTLADALNTTVSPAVLEPLPVAGDEPAGSGHMESRNLTGKVPVASRIGPVRPCRGRSPVRARRWPAAANASAASRKPARDRSCGPGRYRCVPPDVAQRDSD